MTIRYALAIAAVSSLPLAARSLEVWTAGSTDKIRPDAAVRSQTTSSIAAAKNEFEAFQVVVTGPATQVSASATDLAGPGKIGGVKLYREELIDLQQPSSLDGATGRFPDALVPDVDDVVGEKRNAFPFDVPAGESRAIWVEVHIPADARAGTYQGAVSVSAAEGAATVPVTLTVWDFALPSTASLKSYFGLAYGTLVAAHGVSGDAYSALRARYMQLALDHRISVSSSDDGNSDLGHFDTFYGPLLDGSAPTQLKGARFTSVSYSGGPSVSDYASWAQHFRAHGWFDRLFQYTCDEPPLTCNWSDIPARAAVAKAADPAFRTLVTTDIQESDPNGVTSAIDVMVPVINFMDDKPGDATYAGPQRAKYDAFLSSGTEKELWLYQSCMSDGCGGTVNMGSPSDNDRYYTGWPSYMIDASAVRARAMEWLSFRFGGTGELYYETTMAYSHDPWNNQWDFSGNGDGTLFYPGTPSRIGGQTDIPVASIRMKMIREGMEDYEYLKRLADDGDPQFAQQIAASVFPNAYTTDAKSEDLMAARETVARRILQLEGKTVPPPVIASGQSFAQASMVSGGGCGETGRGAGGLVALALALAALARRRRPV